MIDVIQTLQRLLIEGTRPHYEWLDPIGNNKTCATFVGGFGGRFCLEWKVQRSGRLLAQNATLLTQIEKDLSQFLSEISKKVGQQGTWAPAGKGRSDNAILAVWFADRANASDTKLEWASATYPKFWTAIRDYLVKIDA